MTTISDKQEKSAHSVGCAEFPFVFMSVSHTRPRWDVPGQCTYVSRRNSPDGGGCLADTPLALRMKVKEGQLVNLQRECTLLSSMGSNKMCSLVGTWFASAHTEYISEITR